MINKFIIFIQFLILKFKFYLRKNITHIIYKRHKSNLIYQKHIDEIKNNGYSLIDNFFSKDDCDEIIKDLDNFISNNQKYLSYNEDQSDVRVFGINNSEIKFIKKFNEDKIFQDIGENFIECKIRNFFTMFGKTKFKEQNPGSGGGWHRDSIQPSYKTMIYLSDVNEKNGAFQIIKNSNNFSNIIRDHYHLNNKKLLNTRFSNNEINKLIKNFKYIAQTIPGKAGTILLFDGSNLHRGQPLIEGERYALTNYYYPASKKIDPEHFKPMYEK